MAYQKMILFVPPKLIRCSVHRLILRHNRSQRLYWFTVEFGLINTTQGARAYGGGILSSKGETIYSVDSNIPERRPFDVLQILRTPYRYDIMQTTYYVINDFNDFYQLLDLDLIKLTEEAAQLGDFEANFPLNEVDPARSC